MRHKVFMALQELPEINGIRLSGVSEFDETFVLDCYKGKKPDGSIPGKPRKHGAKAGKRGISNEYVCICTGIQRGSNAYAATANRAKPSAGEFIGIFENHITDETLALCDGLRNYHVFPGIADCTMEDCNGRDRKASSFYNLNAINEFHSFIKHSYVSYRGVASKYINRYNSLFAAAYRNAENIIKQLTDTVLAITDADYYHSIKDIKEVGLVAL